MSMLEGFYFGFVG